MRSAYAVSGRRYALLLLGGRWRTVRASDPDPLPHVSSLLPRVCENSGIDQNVGTKTFDALSKGKFSVEQRLRRPPPAGQLNLPKASGRQRPEENPQ